MSVTEPLNNSESEKEIKPFHWYNLVLLAVFLVSFILLFIDILDDVIQTQWMAIISMWSLFAQFVL